MKKELDSLEIVVITAAFFLGFIATYHNMSYWSERRMYVSQGCIETPLLATNIMMWKCPEPEKEKSTIFFGESGAQ